MSDNICIICGREGHRANHCPWYVPLCHPQAWLTILLTGQRVGATQRPQQAPARALPTSVKESVA